MSPGWAATSWRVCLRHCQMPLLAPTINSYKRLVEKYWAPVFVNWGLEDPMAGIRVITPPTSALEATRLEIRIPGADLHPHYSLNAMLAAGWRGVGNKTPLLPRFPPRPQAVAQGLKFERLAPSLQAATTRFKASDSIAREIMGDEFVNFYAASREHEIRQWNEDVTDW